MPTIQINNQVLGGIADSKYLGIAGSVAKMVGFDIHSEPGVMKVNQKLTKISGDLIDGLIKRAVPCSNGEIYLFSADSGKIWRIKSDYTTVELCYTTAAGAGESKCLGADEYNGYITWYTQNRVHRITLANALVSTWTTVELNWKTFANGDLLYHPSSVQNDVLYIGDKNVIAQIDVTTFSSNALKIPVKHRVSCMMNWLTSILAGTFVSDHVRESLAVLWNTWSISFSFKDEIPEGGVNSALKMDNYAVAQIGKKGNFYSFNGSQMDFYKKIPGDWGGPFGPNTAIVYPDANINAGGIPMFGLSNVYGNPADQGIYSLGHYSPNYPIVFNLEFVISTGHIANINIGSIVMVGTNVFVCWKDGNGTITYGIDKLDMTAKFNGAYFDSRLIQLDRSERKEFLVKVFYRTLPTSTDITLKTKLNNGSWSAAPITLIKDAARQIKYTKVKIKANAAEFRVITSASGNTAPEIEDCQISY